MILQHRKKKKKIRGFKRQVRKIEHWKKAAMDLNLWEIERNERIHPLHALKKRQPPIWYQQLFLESLLDVYEHWDQKLNQTRKDFELQLWICFPYITDSQIVVSKGDSFHSSDRIYDPAFHSKPFPGDVFPRLKMRLEKLDWQLHIESEVFTESDLKRNGLTVQEKKQILSQVYQQTELYLCEGKKETIYSIKAGDVWVGRRKQGMIKKSTSYHVCKT